MSASDIDRVRFAVPPAALTHRSPAGQRFDDALGQAPGHGDPGRHSGDDNSDSRGGDHHDEPGGDRGSSQQPSGRCFELRDGALPPAVLQMVRASLARDPSDALVGTDLPAQLLHDIADGVRAGRALPGDRWRMLVRLQSALLPSTEVEISCTGAQLSVVLRTADEDAYRKIVEALPRLNEALAERRVDGGAVVFLVTPKDLD